MATPLPQGPLPDTNTGTPGQPPLGGSVDVGDLLGSVVANAPSGGDYQAMVAQQQRNLTNAQSQMASDFSQINDLSTAITSATKAAGADDVTVASQKAQGLLAAQNAARSVASSYGGNPDDVSFIMNKLGQQWEQSESDRLAALKVVTDKQSVSFADDPLTWFANKFSINADINKYNDLEEQSNTLYDQLSKINTLNTTTAESMKAIAQTQTAATVAATTDAAAQNATIAASKAQLEGLTYNIKGIQDVTQMGQDQVDNAVKSAQTAIAQGHLAVAQQQIKIMSDEYEQRAALYQQDVKDKQAADATDQLVADTTNRGRAALGLQPLPSAKIFSMFKLGGEAGEALKQQYTAGAMGDAVGKPIIAASAGTAARVLATNQSPLAIVNPAVKPVITVLQDAYTLARNPANAQAMGIKDAATLDNAVSGLVNQKVTAMAADIKANDSSNIYQAPPLTALATLPAVKNNPLYAKVLAPQVKAGMTETDPNKILALTSAAIQNGDISLQDAASGMAGLFSSAVAMNTGTKDYLRFGIAPQAGYNTTLDGAGSSVFGMFGGAAKIDMTNKAQVTTALMKYMSGLDAHIAAKLQSQGYGNNPTMMDVLTGNKTGGQ